MRLGKNPYKEKSVESYTQPRVLASVLTYVPYLTGYYQSRFDTLKVCLSSLIKHTPGELCDILVFDQGSDKLVTDYLIELYDSGRIDYLHLSNHNLGYNGALNEIYAMAGSRILSYSDDDVFYYPGWLEAQLQILETYPDVGMVSGFPTKTKYVENNQVAISLPEKYPIEIKIQPWNYMLEEQFLVSVGTSLSQANYVKTHDVPKYTLNNVEAYPVNSHFQYLITPDARKAVYPFATGRAMSSSPEEGEYNMRQAFDKKLDQNNFGKLCTVKPYARHMGNLITAELTDELNKYDLEHAISKRTPSNNISTSSVEKFVIRMMNISLISKAIKYLHGFTFRVINKKKVSEK